MQDNNREMPKVDEALYFVIEEKNNQVELTDNGIKFLITRYDGNFFVLPDIGTEIAKSKTSLKKMKKQKRKKNYFKIFQ
jgi:preprotein translocase subunit SecA